MSDLITNTNELQRVLSELGSRVVDPSQLETENKTIVGAINELKSGKVSSIDYSTQPDTKMHEIFGYIREKGLTGRWVVLNLLGHETGVYGLGLNWYGGDVYGLYGINLQNGAIASNTNSWTDVPISDFKNSFIHPITSGSLPSELMYTQVEYLNTDAKTIVGAINSLYDIFNEGGADGVGISDITKTGTSGKVDTYTITLTDGNTKTFTVTNGADGKTPVKGTDYFTSAEIDSIVTQAAGKINLSSYATQKWVTDQKYTTNTGTVTSVGLSAPTGFSVSNSPVTDSGTLTLSFADGYSLPTTAKQTNWDTAYGWGNHANAGYVKGSISGNGLVYGEHDANAKTYLVKSSSTAQIINDEGIRSHYICFNEGPSSALPPGNAVIHYDSSKKAIKFVFN